MRSFPSPLDPMLEAEQRIVLSCLLDAESGATAGTIANRLEWTLDDAVRVLRSLVSDGLVSTEGTGSETIYRAVSQSQPHRPSLNVRRQ